MANHNLTVNTTYDSKGMSGTITLTYPGGSTTGPGESAANPYTIAPGDTITFVRGTINDSNAPVFYSYNGLQLFTNDSTIQMTSTSSNVVRTSKTIATGSSAVEIKAVSFNALLSGVSDSFWVIISGDSVPSFNFSNITGATPYTLYTRTATISGMSTGNTCYIVTEGNVELKLNSGAYKTSYDLFNTPFEVSNGDVLTARIRSPGGYDSTQTYRVAAKSYGAYTFSDVITASTSTAPAGTSYGFEVFNSSGVNTLTTSSRSSRFVLSGSGNLTLNNSASGTAQILTASTTVTVSGMLANDNWIILYGYTDSVYGDNESWELTKNTGSFQLKVTAQVQANQSAVYAYNYTVLLGG